MLLSTTYLVIQLADYHLVHKKGQKKPTKYPRAQRDVTKL